MPKILCPRHDDTNPSMEVYPGQIGHCFVCKATVDLSNDETIPEVKAQEPEDLKVSYQYIDSLPYERHRGLTFRSNKEGFFIEWLDRSYYKFRKHNGEPRYRAPRGHKQPLMKYGNGPGLIIVEGELNCLSLAYTLLPNTYTVVTPGSAGGFLSSKEELLTLAKKHKNVLLWCDEDGPGIKAIWELAPYLVGCLTYISNYDANDFLKDRRSADLKALVERMMNGKE